jgi:mannose-6-phosphate isomerase-like protein (cupin superfamily)
MAETRYRVFDLDALLADQRASGESWLEFLRVASLRTGVYVLEPGAWDSQTPHQEDEVYFIVRGRATFQAGAERWPVGPGAVIFVAAHAEHRFTDITEELTILVFFAAPRREPA